MIAGLTLYDCRSLHVEAGGVGAIVGEALLVGRACDGNADRLRPILDKRNRKAIHARLGKNLLQPSWRVGVGHARHAVFSQGQAHPVAAKITLDRLRCLVEDIAATGLGALGQHR